MMNDWQRPETSPYPRIYSRFKGKRPMPDGRIPDFWVQDATPDMADEIIEHMVTYFMRDETIARSFNFKDKQDKKSAEKGREQMRDMVRKRLSVAAMTDWPDGKPHLAGVNLLYVYRRGDKQKMLEVIATDPDIRKFLHIMFLTLDMVDVHSKYGVEEFTTAVGLSVKPDFRGQNVGVELLKARVEMTQAVGLRLTLNNFTGPASQKTAERAGFELLAEVPYKEIKDDDGKEMFPGVEAKTLQFRAKYIDEVN